MKKVIWMTVALLLFEIGFKMIPVASSLAVPTAPVGVARALDDLVPLVDSLSQQLQQLSIKVEILWDADLPP